MDRFSLYSISWVFLLGRVLSASVQMGKYSTE